MVPHNLTYLLQYLAEQVKQPAGNLPRLAPVVLALFPVCQVCLLHVKELCPRTLESQSSAHLAERKQLLYPAQFALFKRRPVEVIKIELRKRNGWRYFRKISYF